MGTSLQNLNMDAEKPSSIINTGGLNAAFSGSNDTAVLRFNAPGTVTGLGITETTTAADGTSITITRPGLYVITGAGLSAPSTTVHVGVSANVAAGGLTLNPSYAINGFLSVQAPLVGDADAGFPINFTGIFIEVLKGTAQVIRFHATDGADGAPDFTGAIAFWSYQIRRVQGARGHS